MGPMDRIFLPMDREGGGEEPPTYLPLLYKKLRIHRRELEGLIDKVG